MKRSALALAAVVVVVGSLVAAAAPDRIDRAASVIERAERVRSVTVDVRRSTKYEIRCAWSEDRVSAAGGPRVTVETATIYAGTAQVSANNKDPRLIRFDRGEQTWCRDDLEVTGDDQQGYGLAWDGDRLYAIFSATGTQGAPSEDFRRFATGGWLRSYSDASSGGGGAKVAVLVRVDPATGRPDAATFLTALLSNGRINSLDVADLEFVGSDLMVDVQSFFSPRGLDRTPLECAGGSPFDVRYVFESDLARPVSVDAVRCD